MSSPFSPFLPWIAITILVLAATLHPWSISTATVHWPLPQHDLGPEKMQRRYRRGFLACWVKGGITAHKWPCQGVIQCPSLVPAQTSALFTRLVKAPIWHFWKTCFKENWVINSALKYTHDNSKSWMIMGWILWLILLALYLHF